MTAGDSDYGSRLFRLWRADLRDRFTGNAARANARWGFLRTPAGRGRLLWMATGAGHEDVRLAVDALCAVREKRLDLRLALTFEREYADLLGHARDLHNTVVGYGPCDVPAAVRRALKTLAPFGAVFVRHAPRANLARTLADMPAHAVALNSAPAPGRFEAAYPANHAQALSWHEAGNADYVAAPADLETLLVEAQVDPSFRSLVCGTNELRLWGMHGLGTAHAAALATGWYDSHLAERGVLFLAPHAAITAETLEQALPVDPARRVRLSRWPRTAVPPGTIVLVDEDRWLPAIAASATAVHFFAGASSRALWHGLAGGSPVSLVDPALYACLAGNGSPQDEVQDALAVYEDLVALFDHWQGYAADPLGARRAGERRARISCSGFMIGKNDSFKFQVMPWLERHWYRLTPVSVLLAPLAYLYCLVSALRRRLYRLGVLRAVRVPVPVIVVGNVTVGGTGKTPLVLWLVRFLQEHGYRPGIVTRGYGGRARTWPQRVIGSADPAEVGDEPVLLARRAGCPVVADSDRVRAAEALVRAGCDVVVADDGLQHHRLARDLEIGVIDGERRFGNRLCLPAGPMREPAGRWREVDVRVAQGMPREGEWGMRLAERGFYRLGAMEHVQADYFRGKPVHAVAGIGHPARFFALLRRLGLEVIEHPFPDHHRYRAAELDFGDGLNIIMTEKDAVKCERLGVARGWYLAVEAVSDRRLGEGILQLLEERRRG